MNESYIDKLFNENVKQRVQQGTVCCAPGCDNSTNCNRDVSWHVFPKDPSLKREWVRRIQRRGSTGKYSSWKPTSHHRLCGIHFNESGKKKRDEAVPRFFSHRTYPIYESSSKPRKTRPQPVPDQSNTHIHNFSTLDLGAEVVYGGKCSATPDQLLNVTQCQEKNKSSHTHQYEDHTYPIAMRTTCLDSLLKERKLEVEELITENLRLTAENEHIKIRNKLLEKSVNVCEKQCRTLNHALNVEKAKPQGEVFSLNTVLKDEKKVAFYTGFASASRLTVFIDFIADAYRTNNTKPTVGRPVLLDIHEQIFLVLCRLRLGLLERDIAYRYNISETTVSSIWSFWIPFMSSYLSQVPIWPSQCTVKKYMPDAFKTEYPTTRVILDCTEIFIENPSEFRVQSNTYSTYKSHNTAKGLIGITPNGFVSLVSDLYGGRVSDKVITSESGLYKLLENGDSVMADRGFLIASELEELGVGLNIPPFLEGRPQLSVSDEKLTRDIARLRIHVERVIRNIKQFRILKYVFPNSMSGKLNDVWKVCCYLNNFTNEPLLNRT